MTGGEESICVLCGGVRRQATEGGLCRACRETPPAETGGRGVLRRLLRIKARRTASGAVIFHR